MTSPDDLPLPEMNAEAEAVRFDKFFTLDEAAGLVPKVRAALKQAWAELQSLQEKIVLYKRIQMSRRHIGQKPTPEEEAALKHVWEEYETTFKRWINFFLEQGILLRDMQQGLVDFPYQAQTGEVFMLCWKSGEDGLFYFHDPEDGYMGRQPITLLPE